MTHSEACRKRFDEIEKKKLDKQLEEEAARIPEPPSEVQEMGCRASTGAASNGWNFEFFWTSGTCPGGGYRWQIRVRMK